MSEQLTDFFYDLLTITAVWNLVVLLIFGALVGWLVSLIVKRNEQMGAGANIFIGILGGLIAGLVVRFLFPNAPAVSGINLYSICLGILGALAVLLITGWFRAPEN